MKPLPMTRVVTYKDPKGSIHTLERGMRYSTTLTTGVYPYNQDVCDGILLRVQESANIHTFAGAIPVTIIS